MTSDTHDDNDGACQDNSSGSVNASPKTTGQGASLTRKAVADKTITMLMEAGGRKSVELQPSILTNMTGGGKTIKKALGNDEGIIADEDKYDVKDVLAKGGMGMVMAAQDVNIRRHVAVKVMLPQAQETTESLLRFVEEAQVTGQLEHPNIVPVHELGVQPSGQVFYTMKMIKGRTLKDVLKKIKKGDKETIREFNLTRLITIFMKICDAVAFAHDHKVIHRDLKPENIMIGEFGEVLVVDWGLAKILQRKTDDSITVDDIKLDKDTIESVRSTGSDQHVTMDGKIMGTPRYMAPEQVRGINANIDCRADIYSLGAILYTTLTLHNHVGGDQVYEILKNSLTGEHVSFDTYEHADTLPHCPGNKLPSGLKAVTEKCLRVKPAERYQGVQDLQKDIEAWQEGYATEAENASLVRQVALLVARNKAIFSVVGISILLLGLFGGVAIREIIKERDAANVAKVQAEKARDIAESERAKKEAALVKEEKAKQQAIYERVLAIEARENERLAKEDERKARKKAELENYCNTLHLIKARIDEGSFDQARTLLWSLPKDYRHWEWGYLLKRSSPELVSLDCKRSVYAVTPSPNGLRIAAGCAGGRIKIWDAESGRELKSWKGHRYRVQSIVFSPDGERILTNGNGKVAYVWNAKTGKKLLTLNVEGEVRFKSGVFSADGRRIITVTGPEVRWLKKRMPMEPTSLFESTLTVPRKFTFPGYEAFTKTGDQFVLQEEPEAVQLWDASSGKRLPAPAQGKASTSSVEALLPDCKRIAILDTSEPNTVQLWDFKSQKVLSILNGHGDSIRSVVFSPDGRHVLTGSEDKTARLWDVMTGKQLAVYKGHSGSVYTAAFSSGGRLIMTGGGDDSINIWNVDSEGGKTVLPFETTITGGVFSRDGERIALDGYKAKICDVKTQRLLTVLEGDGNYTDSLGFSPDGRHIVGRCMGKAFVWNSETGRIQHVFEGSAGSINCVAFTPDGKRIATAGKDGTVRFWNPDDGKLLRSFGKEGLDISSVVFSPDGNRMLWLGSTLVRTEGVAQVRKRRNGVWDAKTGEPLFSFGGNPNSLAYSTKGDRIITGERKVARVLGAHGGELSLTLKGHGDWINWAAFTPDGQRIVTASDDKTIRIWDAVTGREFLTINEFTGKLYSAGFSPDGLLLLTTSEGESPQLRSAYDWRFDKKDFRELKLNEYKAFLKAEAPTR